MTMDVDFTYFLTYWREFVQCNLRKIPRNLSKKFDLVFKQKKGGIKRK
jgi:hypothetical protein